MQKSMHSQQDKFYFHLLKVNANTSPNARTTILIPIASQADEEQAYRRS